MGTYEIQYVTFYRPIPKAIHCMSYDTEQKKLAISRSNNDIEIWNLRHTPHVDRVILCDNQFSVESIAWYNGRLFGASLQEVVMEYDLLNLSIKHIIPVSSGPCWCIAADINSSTIAAGTESGYINLLKIYEDTVINERLLDKQEGRILCLAWSPDGDYIATGSVDALRIWNVKTGHAIHKLTTGRLEANKETIVWCLTITEDFTIISGDSRGIVTFWDGYRGLYTDSHQSHKADVLAVCLSNDHRKLYCAGVDPLIASFEKINLRGSDNKCKWVKSIQRVIHDHDVRALTIVDEKLFSGGVDGYLALSSYPPKTLIKFPPLTQGRKISLAADGKYIMFTYDDWLEIWDINNVIEKLVEIKSYKNKRIRCSCISSNGYWIAYSTDYVFRLLSLQVSDDKAPRIKRINGIPSEVAASTCMTFSKNNQYLAFALKNRVIKILKLSSDDEIILCGNLNSENPILLIDTVHLISVSNKCEYLAAADRIGNIAVWKTKNKSEHQLLCSVPKYKAIATALTIDLNHRNILICYADHKIMELDLKLGKYSDFSRILDGNHPKEWLNRQFPVYGVLHHPTNANIYILYDDTRICILDKSKKLTEVKRKIPRLEGVKTLENSNSSSETSNSQYCYSNSEDFAFHVLKAYKHLAFVDILSSDHLVAVEVTPESLIQNTPAIFPKNKFGCK